MRAQLLKVSCAPLKLLCSQLLKVLCALLILAPESLSRALMLLIPLPEDFLEFLQVLEVFRACRGLVGSRFAGTAGSGSFKSGGAIFGAGTSLQVRPLMTGSGGRTPGQDEVLDDSLLAGVDLHAHQLVQEGRLDLRLAGAPHLCGERVEGGGQRRGGQRRLLGPQAPLGGRGSGFQP